MSLVHDASEGESETSFISYAKYQQFPEREEQYCKLDSYRLTSGKYEV